MEKNLRVKQIRGEKTSYLEINPEGKEVLFFFHGFPDDAYSWNGLLTELSLNYHCIAPFARGLNESPMKDDNRLTLDSQTLDFLEILKVANAENKKIHLISHDLGAVAAWRMAQVLGKRATTLTVINGLSLKQFLRRLTNPQQLVKSWYIWLLQVPGLMETILKKKPNFVLEKAAALGGRDISTFNLEALKGFKLYRQYLKETPVEIKNNAKVKARVLSINSLEDAFLLPTTLDELEKDCQNPEARIIPGKHWIHHENPKVVADLITKFIGKKNDKSQSSPEVGL